MATNISFRDTGLDVISQFLVAWAIPSSTTERIKENSVSLQNYMIFSSINPTFTLIAAQVAQPYIKSMWN